MKEIWAYVPDYDLKYQVSNLGNIRNKSGKILSQETTKNGYKRVTLSMNGKTKHHMVHRLVAICFLPNPSNFPCVNHKDENKTNNNVNNIEWCTYSHNVNYGNRNYKIMSRSKKVAQMDFYGNILATYISVDFASKIMNVDPSNIYKCCRGEISYAYDFKWKYI